MNADQNASATVYWTAAGISTPSVHPDTLLDEKPAMSSSHLADI
jgi:hypothetical protein